MYWVCYLILVLFVHAFLVNLKLSTMHFNEKEEKHKIYQHVYLLQMIDCRARVTLQTTKSSEQIRDFLTMNQTNISYLFNFEEGTNRHAA